MCHTRIEVLVPKIKKYDDISSTYPIKAGSKVAICKVLLLVTVTVSVSVSVSLRIKPEACAVVLVDVLRGNRFPA